jgi:protein CWC15
MEKSKREAEERNEAILRGNPLLNLAPSGMPASTGATVKRRWDDDLIFRNQARDEPDMKKRFINDAIRSDFHRKFLSKYIK